MQNYTYTTDSMHFIWCCIQVRGERGVLSAWSEGVGRCLYGGINPPLTTHDEPDEDSDSVQEEEEKPLHSNSTCADVLLAVIVTLQGEGRWRTREPKFRQLDSWLESLIEREVNCCQSWICTRCTFFFAPQGIVAWQYASRFFRRIPVKRFFPPCSEWVMTNTIDIIVEFLERSISPRSKTATFSSTVNIELVLSLASSPSTSQLRDCGANCTFSEQTRLPFLAAGAGGQRCKSAR